MASMESEEAERLSTYRGKPQPPVNERLQQIYNFLADEDYYRCLNFTEKLRDIKDYIRDLETGSQIFVLVDEDLLSHIIDQINIHDRWIEEATRITPFEFNSPLLKHHNRFNLPGWTPKPGLINHELEDLPNYEINPPIIEAKLHVTLQEDTGRNPPRDPDPFEYTRKVAEYKDMQNAVAQTLRERYNRGIALAFNPLPRNFKGPWVPPAPETLLKKWEEEREKLVELCSDLMATSRRAPRFTLSQVVHMLTTVFTCDTPSDDMLLADEFTSADMTKLRVLTRRSTHRTKPSNLRGPHLTFVARVNGLIRSTDTWPEEVEEAVGVEDLLKMVASKGPLNLGYDGMMQALEYMHEDKNLRYDKFNYVVRAPYPNNHPEDRATAGPGKWSVISPGVTLSEWAYLGVRLADAIVKLTTQLEMANSDDGPEYMKAVVGEYAENLALRIRAWEKDVNGTKGVPSLIEMAQPLVKDEIKSELTEELAMKILQEKIVEESNRNWEPRATPTTIWKWTRKREPLTEEYFSVDRWTPSIQHVGDVDKENMYLEWARNQRPSDHPDRPPRKRTKLIAGEPTFPLGETTQQEEAIDNRINNHLSKLGAKEFEDLYGEDGSYTRMQKAMQEARAKAIQDATAKSRLETAARARVLVAREQAKGLAPGAQDHTKQAPGAQTKKPESGALALSPMAEEQVTEPETGAEANAPEK